MKFITRKDIFEQLKKDLIGKDSYRGVTLTYSWMANQFGHFSLGFIPTFILYKIFVSSTSINPPALWASLIVWSIWILFELFNFLWPLLKPAIKGQSSIKYTFKPEWGNIAFDTATDLCFFGIGGFTASLICGYSSIAAYLLVILTLLIIYPAYHWYTTKMYLQNAEYPFQHRLSQWQMNITDSNRAAIIDFVENTVQGKHLLLFGSKGSGKTTLSVGIATEASIRKNPCSYVTAVKLLCMFFEKEDQKAQKSGLWTWRDSSILVIDDINPGGLIKDDILTAKLFYQLLNNLDCGPSNIKHIREKNIIWVMGNEDPNKQLEEKWETLLKQIGVSESNIKIVNLDNSQKG
ncbi:ATP-binding protein [Pedobacter metabolipauper]|uniref:IstB-like ATP binding protein n=1 Tax=Pedobacter metabolipauper TaxID=425513 RepID=A0A4R6SR80_9SPHI|nr:ATP-binding protein [Pedobacter metabolipauper]TDQ07442.1 IstB-like ATP binding protein [Pedobacter metabolipauper]